MATGILDNIKEAVQASLNVSQMKNLTTPIIIDGSEYSTVETALNAINSKSVTVDDELSAVSENPIQNKVITEEINKKLTVVDSLPTASAEFVGKQRLYVGNTTDYLNKGGIYECRSNGSDGYEWVLISTADVDLSKYKKIFTGTREEWGLLTTAEKKEYDICNLTDDLAGGDLVVSNAVTAGDLNPVTSNAVAKALPKKYTRTGQAIFFETVATALGLPNTYPKKFKFEWYGGPSLTEYNSTMIGYAVRTSANSAPSAIMIKSNVANIMASNAGGTLAPYTANDGTNMYGTFICTPID